MGGAPGLLKRNCAPVPIRAVKYYFAPGLFCVGDGCTSAQLRPGVRQGMERPLDAIAEAYARITNERERGPSWSSTSHTCAGEALCVFLPSSFVLLASGQPWRTDE